MPVVDLSSYKPTPGAAADAAQIANGFQAVQNALNGLDSANFAAGAIFDPAKIMQSAAVVAQALVWNGGAWAPGSAGVLQTVALGADTASIDFTSIPANFQNLMVVGALRATGASNFATALLRVNGDTAANYDQHAPDYGGGVWSASALAGQTSIKAGNVPGSTADANRFGVLVIFIPCYRIAIYKPTVSLAGDINTQATVANFDLSIATGAWRNTATITSLSLLTGSTSWKALSQATLIGW